MCLMDRCGIPSSESVILSFPTKSLSPSLQEVQAPPEHKCKDQDSQDSETGGHQEPGYQGLIKSESGRLVREGFLEDGTQHQGAL